MIYSFARLPANVAALAIGRQDVVVQLNGGDASNFRVETAFKPVKIVVDPKVSLLFAGRQRCEKSL